MRRGYSLGTDVSTECTQFFDRLGSTLCDAINAHKPHRADKVLTEILKHVRGFTCRRALEYAVGANYCNLAKRLLSENVANPNMFASDISTKSVLAIALEKGVRDHWRMVKILLAAGAQFANVLDSDPTSYLIDELCECICTDARSTTRMKLLLEDNYISSSTLCSLGVVAVKNTRRTHRENAFILIDHIANRLPFVVWESRVERYMTRAIENNDAQMLARLISHGVPDHYQPLMLFNDACRAQRFDICQIMIQHILTQENLKNAFNFMLGNVKVRSGAMDTPLNPILFSVLKALSVKTLSQRKMIQAFGWIMETSAFSGACLPMLHALAQRIDKPEKIAQRQIVRRVIKEIASHLWKFEESEFSRHLTFPNTLGLSSRLAYTASEPSTSYYQSQMFLFLIDTLGINEISIFLPLYMEMKMENVLWKTENVVTSICNRAVSMQACDPWRPKLHAGLPPHARLIPRTMVMLAKARLAPVQEPGLREVTRGEARFPDACLHLLPEELLQLIYEFVGMAPHFGQHYSVKPSKDLLSSTCEEIYKSWGIAEEEKEVEVPEDILTLRRGGAYSETNAYWGSRY